MKEVFLVIYLAGMGPSTRDLDRVWPYFVMFPKMTLHHTQVPLRHPLAIKMTSLEACLPLAERERARGNKASCRIYGGSPVINLVDH